MTPSIPRPRRWCLARSGAVPAVALALLCLAPAGLWAANYHAGIANLHCAECHVMHASHDGVTYGGGAFSPTGFPALLKGQTVNELCLSCHDGGTGTAGTAPDVAGPASYETAALKRCAGAFQAGHGLATANGHDLGVGGQTAPGGTWSSGTGVSCVDCHDPHGNTNYRNLVMRPGTAAADRPVTDVSQTLVTPTSTHYSVTNTRYTGAALAAWCMGCHTSPHGNAGDVAMGGSAGGDAPGSSSYWLRHPTEAITMSQGATNGHVDPAYWFSALQSRPPVVSASATIPGGPATSDNQPFCGSCHKAHGSTHRAGLIWDDPTSAALEDGTSVTQTCQACHHQ